MNRQIPDPCLSVPAFISLPASLEAVTGINLTRPLYVRCLVAQSCPALCDPVDCSPPGSSVHGILQARTLEWGSLSLLQRIFPTQGLNPGLPHCRWILYHLSHLGLTSVWRVALLTYNYSCIIHGIIMCVRIFSCITSYVKLYSLRYLFIWGLGF